MLHWKGLLSSKAILKAMASDAGAVDDFLEDALSCQNTDKLLSTLATDGGMSKADEVYKFKVDILGPCVTVKRAQTAECTALVLLLLLGYRSRMRKIVFGKIWMM